MRRMMLLSACLLVLATMRSAVSAGSALASADTPLASSAAVRISPNMSRSLLLAQPSLPNARFTPAASSFAAGQNPDASFRFDSGQWTTDTPASAQRAISWSERSVMWIAIRLRLTRPSPSMQTSEPN